MRIMVLSPIPEGFKKDGKLYGLPRNTDVAGFYYNEKMFKDNGWEVPAAYDELLDLAQKISGAGLHHWPWMAETAGRWQSTCLYPL